MTFQLLVHVAFVINCVVAGFTWAMYYAAAPIVDAMRALTAADDVRAEEEMHAALLLNFVGLRGACDDCRAAGVACRHATCAICLGDIALTLGSEIAVYPCTHIVHHACHRAARAALVSGCATCRAVPGEVAIFTIVPAST
jgi:hypothetical protein